MEKGIWEKMLEEYPESEKEIKDTFGYQVEMLRKQLDELMEPIIAEFKTPIDTLLKYIREYYSFKQRLKRFLKRIFNWSS